MSKKAVSHPAEVKNNKRISAIWLLPFIAFCIGVMMVFQQWNTQGPLITINISSAEGLEAGKTKIKTHNVDIGMVKSIELNNDNDGVIVTARINKQAEHLLAADSQIWVVSPRISNAGITGFNTLLSGVYIELAPGSKQKVKTTAFTALKNPPVTPVGTPGLHITLTSNDKINYSIGDTVQYRGLTIGKFEGVDFDINTKTVRYNVFIEAPYHQLLTNKTRFWDITGLEVDLSANGISVKAENLQSILGRGVAFDDPPDNRPGKHIDSNATFTIYPDKKTANTPKFNYGAIHTLLISSSVRGLTEGAPVEFRGINVGTVLSINPSTQHEQSLLNQEYRIPVQINIQPGKIGLDDSQASVDEMLGNIKTLVNQGLRAKLKRGNLLTGQLFVELQLYPDEQTQKMTYFDDTPVIPVISDDLDSLADNTDKFISKLNKLPLEELTENINQTIKSLNTTVENVSTVLNDVEQQHIVKNLNVTLTETQELMKSYSQGSQSYEEVVNTLKNVESLLTAAENLASSYSKGSDNYDNINQTLTRLNAVMLELQPLLLNLNKQPNSLIFSGPKPADIEPKARK